MVNWKADARSGAANRDEKVDRSRLVLLGALSATAAGSGCGSPRELGMDVSDENAQAVPKRYVGPSKSPKIKPLPETPTVGGEGGEGGGGGSH